MAKMSSTEKEWLRAYRKGDLDALANLIEHYRRPLFSFILGMVNDMTNAEDIYQETWLKAIRAIDRFSDSNLLGWLFSIARNLVIDQTRRRKPESSLDAAREDGHDLHEQIPDHRPNPSQQFAASDIEQRVSIELSSLPAEQREVFLLRMEGGISFKEIAQLQNVSINTALGRMHYAVQRLRERLSMEFKPEEAS